MLSGLLNSRRRYYGVTKYRLIEIRIRRPILFDKPVKNGTLLALLNVFNVVKDNYFRVIFIVILRALVFFKKKIGVLLKKRTIEQRLYSLLIAGYALIVIRTSN
jgi:hypothetical protein